MGSKDYCPVLHGTRDDGDRKRDGGLQGGRWSRSRYHAGAGLGQLPKSELANVLHDVDGAVVLSGYPSVLYQDLYGDWATVQCTTMADSRKKRTEVLWLNEKASSGIQMDLLEKGA